MEQRFRDDPNFQMLLQVAIALDDLCDELVFLGGCATSLLVTSIRAESVRVTRDVDVVAKAVSAAEYHALERKLAARGFEPDTSDDAPICRRIREGIRLDVMPRNPQVLGFSNRWYPLAVQSAISCRLREDVFIRLVTAPVFIATKLEAFRDRGRSDYLASHDLEDLLSVIDGRDAIASELLAADEPLRHYVQSELSELLRDENFVLALPGHLPADPGAQARLPRLLERLKRMAAG